jgi:GT2 family glycosyltransferase
MITIIYSTHKDVNYNSVFKKHLETTVGLKNTQILEYQNNNEFSLSQIYNRGIGESIYDIVVCLHNDVKLEQGWGKKLIKDFEDNLDYGIIGKAGSCYFPESGVYWERMSQTMVGQVYHHPEGQNKWINKYSPKLPFLIPVVTLDGLFLSFNKTKIKHTFDETIGKYHFYDHPFSLSNYLDGVKLGVTTSFEITHKSIGKPNDEFYKSKDVFLEKYKTFLPLELKPNTVYIPEIKEKSIKISAKTAVIIPTKSKLNLLFDCINSIIEHSDKEQYELFIADTGSSLDEINQIKNFILEKSDFSTIHLIQYDYYNFAKINNDVVKNHVSNDFEYILFCNNDIKFLNNIIYGLMKIHKQNHNVGTVGCRLHFEDNLVQHDGIISWIAKPNDFKLSHSGFKSYYKYTTNIKKVIGNTAGLLMIKKKTFENMGFFNETYKVCFEDVELNFKCLLSGLTNYFDGRYVAYHYESQTREKNTETDVNMNNDLTQVLIPFANKNIQKLKNYIPYEQ